MREQLYPGRARIGIRFYSIMAHSSASTRYLAPPDQRKPLVVRPRQVGGRGGRDKASGVSPRLTASGADLGGSSSSKYSNENFED